SRLIVIKTAVEKKDKNNILRNNCITWLNESSYIEAFTTNNVERMCDVSVEKEQMDKQTERMIKKTKKQPKKQQKKSYKQKRKKEKNETKKLFKIGNYIF